MENILKSNSLVSYYGNNPDDYTLKFHHYSIVVAEDTKEEYKLLEEDLNFLRKYNKENSILYFSDLCNFNKVLKNTNIFNYLDDIYLRIRNNAEYMEFKSTNININLIVELNDIKNVNPKDDIITVQIDNVNELTIKDLINLNKEYNVKKVLVGQIEYITNDFKYLLDILSDQFNIDVTNQLELEKNNEVTNDIYDIETYIKIIEELNKIIIENTKKEKIETIESLFYYIANNCYFDNEGVKETKIEDQNLIGPLFNKISVCEGYSKLFKQLLSLIDVESIIVIGGGAKEEGGHVWNQIKIDDTWYNADVTAQSCAMHNNENLNMFLVKDECCRYKSTSPFAKKCSENPKLWA